MLVISKVKRLQKHCIFIVLIQKNEALGAAFQVIFDSYTALRSEVRGLKHAVSTY